MFKLTRAKYIAALDSKIHSGTGCLTMDKQIKTGLLLSLIVKVYRITKSYIIH